MTRRQFSARAKAKRLLEFNGRCADCECKVGGAAGLEFDHIIPLELGGDDEIENLQPLCKVCHKAKTRGDVDAIRKAERMRQREAGIKRTRRSIIPGSKASGLKKKMDGTVEKRT